MRSCSTILDVRDSNYFGDILGGAWRLLIQPYKFSGACIMKEYAT